MKVAGIQVACYLSFQNDDDKTVECLADMGRRLPAYSRKAGTGGWACARGPTKLTCVASRSLPPPSPWVLPGPLSLESAHRWVVGTAARAQGCFGQDPAASQSRRPCFGVRSSSRAPTTLLCGAAEAVAHKSSPGCSNPHVSPSLSVPVPPE